MKRQNPQKSPKDKEADLYEELGQAKSKKKVFLKEIKANVRENKSVIKKSMSNAAFQIEPPEPAKIMIKKQKSLMQLSKSLNERIRLDKETKVKLENLSEEQLEKKDKLEKRIEEIKRRNILRMKQLAEFENKYLKKLNEDYLKDKEKEEKLLAEYEQVLAHSGKIKETQKYRKAIQVEDWQAIVSEKRKLQKMIGEYRKKQEILLKEKNPQVIEKMKEESKMKIVQQKVVMPTIVPKIKGDAKQIGNQYLQYAKKLKDVPKQKPKAKLLDVNMKCIDYQGDIMTKIARNTGDLSRFPIPINPILIKETKTARDPIMKMSTFQVKEDEETKKYLRQIRSNLKEMEKQQGGE